MTSFRCHDNSTVDTYFTYHKSVFHLYLNTAMVTVFFSVNGHVGNDQTLEVLPPLPQNLGEPP